VILNSSAVVAVQVYCTLFAFTVSLKLQLLFIPLSPVLVPIFPSSYHSKLHSHISRELFRVVTLRSVVSRITTFQRSMLPPYSPYNTRPRHNLEETDLNLHRREDLKSRIQSYVVLNTTKYKITNKISIRNEQDTIFCLSVYVTTLSEQGSV